MHKLLYQTRWLSLREGYEGMVYVDSDHGVMCVPITPDGQVIFILEPPAYLDGKQILFLPAGSVDEGEAPPESANRELREEIGFRAAQLDFLAILNPWVKYLNAHIHIYLARNLTPDKLEGDEGYNIHTETIPLSQIDDLITAGRLTDATVIAALFLARKKLEALCD